MITVDNVAVGDVIFCTGQSNMFNRLETFPTLMNEELSEAYEDVRYMNSSERDFRVEGCYYGKFKAIFCTWILDGSEDDKKRF